MFQIISAFAAVEQLFEKDMQGLFWEQRRLTPTELCVVLRRPFNDPRYPEKFDVAFRRLNHGVNGRLPVLLRWLDEFQPDIRLMLMALT